MKHIVVGVAVIACALLVSETARGQSSNSGAIAGVVRDTTGAVLPGVTVEAASPALIEKVRSGVTDPQGNYRILDLRPGSYSVTFTLPGFSTYKRDGIELTAGFTATANAELKVGSLEETVTVTGASPVVDIQNVRSQTVISQDLLEVLPAGRTNAGFAELTLGAASTTGGASVVDQGGSKGDSSQRLTVHGMRGNDQRMFYDGMAQNNLNTGGSGKNWMTNQVGVQEVVVGTAVASAEIETSGMAINFIPRDGGNTYALSFLGTGTNGSLQNDNLTDEVRARGVVSSQRVKSVYDIGIGVGGPLVRDRAWFYTANRWWGSKEYQPGSYFNKSTSPFSYVPDLSRQGFQDLHARDNGVRFTVQLTPKQKLNGSYNIQNSCQCYLALNSALAPESAPKVEFWPAQQPIVTWSYTASNRLLFEAGASYGYFIYDIVRDELFPGAVRIQDLTNGIIFGGSNFACCSAGDGQDIKQNNFNQRASVSYVAGSHAFKVGQQWLEGNYDYNAQVSQNLWFTVLGGRPTNLTQWALPVDWVDRVRNVGFYAQDQWTMSRVTLNVGVRVDHFTGRTPAGTRAATPFVGGFSYDEVKDVPNFNDVSPRMGVAYDVFGDGRTAIKGAIGRYVGGQGIDIPDANNPAISLVLSATRTWNDVNGNFIPECDLRSLDANGECAGVNNRLFGQQFRNTFWDPSVTKGFAKRPYSWQGTLALQQELRPGLAVNVAYFRTSYANFTVTQNTRVTAGDFNRYCVTAPSDARLPGGGGNQICGLFDVAPARFGQISNLITAAGDIGTQREQFDGVDVSANWRFAGKGQVQGGVSFGRQQTDSCFVNDRPDITSVNSTVFALPATVTIPRSDAYCHVVPPWSAGTQIKANGLYPLPWWGLEPSFTFQNLPGAQILANQGVPNAAIAPSLGRNLSACPAVGACTATVTIALIPPQTEFLDRVNTLNLSLGKVVRLGKWRARGNVDVYNVFNTGTVLNVNTTYGTNWLRPTTLIGGRLFKFGVQVDY